MTSLAPSAAGIMLAAAAAVLFALGAIGQRRGVRSGSAAGGGLDLRGALALVRNRRWLAGTGLVAGGSLVHLAGLALAPVAVVQPVGTLSVPLSVVLDTLGGRRVPARRTLLSCALTVTGVLTFSVVAALRMATTATTVDLTHLFIVVAVAWTGAAVLLVGSRWRPGGHALPWAAAGGLCYGLATSLLKVLMMLLSAGAGFASVTPWGVALAMGASFAVGSWCVQQGYARGSAAGVMACLAVTDPAVAVLTGLLVLGEAHGLGRGCAVLMSFAGLAAGVGAWRLSLETTPDAGGAGVPLTEETR